MAGRIHIHSLREFFCANVNFKAKPREAVGKEDDPYFDVVTGFKSKCAIIYINHVELTKESSRQEDAGVTNCTDLDFSISL